MSRGMNDVFVTDNGFRPSGPRFDEFGPGGVPPDRSGFGLRYCHSDSLDTFFHPLIHMRDQERDFSLQYQCNIKQTSDESEEKNKLKDYKLIQHQILWTDIKRIERQVVRITYVILEVKGLSL